MMGNLGMNLHPQRGPSPFVKHAVRTQTNPQSRLPVFPRQYSHLTQAAHAGNYSGIHHVGVLCADIQESKKFYTDILGMEINEARPDEKLPYKGAWLWVGSEMIHLMELPNPDPFEGRPEHGGRDRHVCLSRPFLKDTRHYYSDIYHPIKTYQTILGELKLSRERRILDLPKESVKSVDVVAKELDQKGIPYTRSKSGRAAIFFRDPDQNVLEMAEQ